MKPLRLLLGLACLATLTMTMLQFSFSQEDDSIRELNARFPVELSRGNAKTRAEYERLKLQNPATGQIPRAIRSREQAFARQQLSEIHKGAQRQTQTEAWEFRGPVNIGGRTRALVIDALDHNRLLAGSVTGALYESLNGAQSWQRLTPMTQLPGVTCLTQDQRPGHESTWYYGTGEYTGSGSRSINSRVPGYFGDGIFKSSDGGSSWQQLPATADTPSNFGSPFDVVFAIAVHRGETELDRLFAACYGSIQRSEDGGETWQQVLGTFGVQDQAWTNVHGTAEGVLYATLSSSSPDGGIWRSTDGENWQNITPDEWPVNWNRVICAEAPSNESLVYFLAETPGAGYIGSGGGHSFWRYDGVSGEWQNRSSNLPNFSAEVQLPFGYDFGSQGGYDMCVRVKPDDENAVYIGGTSLFRSTDGFASNTNTAWIGGYNYYYGLLPAPEGLDISYPQHHADVHNVVFDPEFPNVIYSSHDGGVSRAELALFDPDNEHPFPWTRSQGYPTTQFYWVSVDPVHEGDTRVLGGMQDNGTWLAVADGAGTPWINIRGGDGMACAIGAWSNPDHNAFYASTQYGGSFMQFVLDQGNQVIAGNWITPNGDFERWITPYVLDPTNNSRLLLGGTHGLWINESLYESGGSWEYLGVTDFPNGYVTAVALAEQPAGRGWYGVWDYSNGTDQVVSRIIRVDDVFDGDPLPMDVTPDNFPAGGWIHCIETHPQNPDEAIVVFTNYEVTSVFRTVDGGFSWSDMGGNLEEFPDGSGAGPSCYWASIITQEEQSLYLLGTSVGLWSTRHPEAEVVQWELEGEDTIGTVWVTAMDVRQQDGFVAVGTHGHGTFSGFVTQTLVEEPQRPSLPGSFDVSSAWPNPFNGSTRLRVSQPEPGDLELVLHDLRGARLMVVEQGRFAAGSHEFQLDATGLASGNYFLTVIRNGQESQSQRIQLVK